jgi:hypothetical protein
MMLSLLVTIVGFRGRRYTRAFHTAGDDDPARTPPLHAALTI